MSSSAPPPPPAPDTLILTGSDISSLPSFACIEYPGVVVSPDAAISTLGGLYPHSQYV